MELRRLNLEDIQRLPHKSIEVVSTFEENNVNIPGNFVDASFLNAGGRNPEAIHDLKRATIETVANAIKHGNQFDINKKVNVFTTSSNGLFYVAIQDQGLGFDLDSCRDSAVEKYIPCSIGIHTDILCEGKGIKLITDIMDDVYNFCDNVAYFSKRIK